MSKKRTEGEKPPIGFAEDFLREHGVESKELGKELSTQVERYIQQLSVIDKRRGREVNSKEMKERYAMMYFLIKEFVRSRNNRVDEIETPEVQEAQKFIESYFGGSIPKFMVCVDGRTLVKLYGCFLGGALHTPAGDNPEFEESSVDVNESNVPDFELQEGKLTENIREHFSTNDSLIEILDSHLACAAGCKNTACSHNYGPDKDTSDPKLQALALYEDVLHKKGKAVAIKDWVKKEYDGTKQVDTIQIAFDPHNGGIFMGLEKDDNLDVAQDNNGYTSELLKKLVSEGKVLSAKNLSEIPEVRDALERSWFELDYVNNYVQSTADFWKNIEQMTPEVLPILMTKISAVFGNLPLEELEKRAKLLLSNIYSYYLLNHGGDKKPTDYKFSKHKESCITVTRSEKGPYQMESFFANPDSTGLDGQLDLTGGLVQKNRKVGSVFEAENGVVEKIYGERKDSYDEEPTPVMFFSRLDHDIGAVLLKRIQEADWTDLADARWVDMTDDEFDALLDIKIADGRANILPKFVYEAFNNLRSQAVKLYRSGSVTATNLRNGNLLPVWSLSSRNRKTLALIPFMVKGFYHEKK